LNKLTTYPLVKLGVNWEQTLKKLSIGLPDKTLSAPVSAPGYNLATALTDNPDFLTAIDYGTHFIARSTTWKNRNTKNFCTTLFPISANLQSRGNMLQELTISLVGEVVAKGCELSACRNTWLRPDQKITDHMFIKNVLVFRGESWSMEHFGLLMSMV